MQTDTGIQFCAWTSRVFYRLCMIIFRTRGTSSPRRRFSISAYLREVSSSEPPMDRPTIVTSLLAQMEAKVPSKTRCCGLGTRSRLGGSQTSKTVRSDRTSPLGYETEDLIAPANRHDTRLLLLFRGIRALRRC